MLTAAKTWDVPSTHSRQIAKKFMRAFQRGSVQKVQRFLGLGISLDTVLQLQGSSNLVSCSVKLLTSNSLSCSPSSSSLLGSVLLSFGEKFAKLLQAELKPQQLRQLQHIITYSVSFQCHRSHWWVNNVPPGGRSNVWFISAKKAQILYNKNPKHKNVCTANTCN